MSPTSSPAAGPCAYHDERPALVRCSSCSQGLCDECFRFRVGGRPGCTRCAYEHSTRPMRRVSLAVSFLCIALGGGFWASQHYDLPARYPGWLVAGGILALAVAIAIAFSGRGDKKPVDRREVEEPVLEGETELVGGGSPYRAQVRRVLLAASPMVSGSVTAVVLIACLAGSAVLVPLSIKLPRWVEAEIVLGIWWLVVGVVVAVILFRGARLRNDYVYFAPWNRPSTKGSGGGFGSLFTKGSGNGCSPGGCSDVGDIGEGCVAAVIAIVFVAVAFVGAWLFVELLAPFIFFLMYWLFMKAIARAARDNRGCQGSLGKAMGWGALWATIYVAPIALATWALHAVHFGGARH